MTHRITHREMEVAELISFGLIEKEMADYLGISIFTLRAHKRNLFYKTGCRNIADVTRWYIQRTAGIHIEPREGIKKLISVFMLMLIMLAEFADSEFIRNRIRARRIARTEVIKLRQVSRTRKTYQLSA